MASNLVRKQITDKNGVTSSRWVRADQSATTGSKLPPPPSASSPKDEAVRISAEIGKRLSAMERAGERVDWWEDDLTHLRILTDTADVDSLRVLQRHLSHGMFSNPEHIGQITRELQRSGIDHPYELMTDEALAARGAIKVAIENWGLETLGVPYLSEQPRSQEVRLMAFTDAKDAPRLVDIIKERGLLSPEGYRAILNEMNDIATPLGRGTL